MQKRFKATKRRIYRIVIFAKKCPWLCMVFLLTDSTDSRKRSPITLYITQGVLSIITQDTVRLYLSAVHIKKLIHRHLYGFRKNKS